MNIQTSPTEPHLPFIAAVTTDDIYGFKILKRISNAKNEVVSIFKYSYSRAWQCYSKSNFNEHRKC
jgi:hypothetical protein